MPADHLDRAARRAGAKGAKLQEVHHREEKRRRAFARVVRVVHGPVQHHLRRDEPEHRRHPSARGNRPGDAARHPHDPGGPVRDWPRSAGLRIRRRRRRGCGCRAPAADRGAAARDAARHSPSICAAVGPSGNRERVHAADDARTEPAADPAGRASSSPRSSLRPSRLRARRRRLLSLRRRARGRAAPRRSPSSTCTPASTTFNNTPSSRH